MCVSPIFTFLYKNGKLVDNTSTEQKKDPPTPPGLCLVVVVIVIVIALAPPLRCSFPIRVGSTGSFTSCGDGTSKNPSTDECFWALPEGNRDLAPGEGGQYVLPELNLREGSLM